MIFMFQKTNDSNQPSVTVITFNNNFVSIDTVPNDTLIVIVPGLRYGSFRAQRSLKSLRARAEQDPLVWAKRARGWAYCAESEHSQTRCNGKSVESNP